MDGVVEIITGREGRRRWSTADKLRIVAEAQEPGVRSAPAAARHDVCESLLFTWRRQVREGVLTAGSDMAMFMPVQMTEAGRTAFASGRA
jgi:transposase